MVLNENDIIIENDRKKCPTCGRWNNLENIICSHCFNYFKDVKEESSSKEEDMDKSTSPNKSNPSQIIQSDEVYNKYKTPAIHGLTKSQVKTKRCPNCNKNLNEVAKLCPYCDYDFINKTVPKSSRPEESQKHKVFLLFYSFIKNKNPTSIALKEAANTYGLETYEVQKWYEEDDWQNKVEGLEKLKKLRRTVYKELYKLNQKGSSKEEAFNKVAKKFNLSKSKIEKWYNKYNWQEKIATEKVQNADKSQRKAKNKPKQKKKLDKTPDILTEEEKATIGLLDFFDNKINDYFESRKENICYNENNNLACLTDKVSNKKRLYTFGIMNSEFIPKLTLKYQISKDFNDNFSDINSNFRFKGKNQRDISLKLNLKYIENHTHFDFDESSKFQYLSKEFSLNPSENRKSHEKYYYDLKLGSIDNDEFFDNLYKLLSLLDFNKKIIEKPEKFSPIADIRVPDDFRIDFENDLLNKKSKKYENQKQKVFEMISDLILLEDKSKNEAITFIYKKYHIPKDVINKWYDDENWKERIAKDEK